MLWYPNGRQWMLCSLAAQVAWEQPVIRSDFPPVDPSAWKIKGDPRPSHRAGHIIHVSGIWTVFDRKQVNEIVATYSASAFGEVTLWGRVAQHELGYRAEYCMIKKLFVPIDQVTLDARQVKVIVTQLEQRYGCDVELV